MLYSDGHSSLVRSTIPSWTRTPFEVRRLKMPPGPGRPRKYTDAEIIEILKKRNARVPIARLTREYGAGRNTILEWEQRFGGSIKDSSSGQGIPDDIRKKFLE